MGDRANIVIRSDWPTDIGPKEAVFLYSHHGGYEMPQTLRDALEIGSDRWDDAQYLARIIFDFDFMTPPGGGSTGYGISTRLCDNEYDLLVLVPASQTLVIVPEKAYRDDGLGNLNGYPSISFADYTACTDRTWDNLTEVT